MRQGGSTNILYYCSFLHPIAPILYQTYNTSNYTYDMSPILILSTKPKKCTYILLYCIYCHKKINQ